MATLLQLNRGKFLNFTLTLFASFFLVTTGGGQTVTTDKLDYAPGEYVIVTGTGWAPGETVSFDFHETPKVCTTDHHYRSTVADESGNIFYNQFLINERHLGVAFVLTATGQSSSLSAITYFTDANVRIRTSSGTATIAYSVYTNNLCSGLPKTGGTGTANIDDDSDNAAIVPNENNVINPTVTSSESIRLEAPLTNSEDQVFSGWISTNSSAYNLDPNNNRIICVPGANGNGALKFEAVYVSCTKPNATISSSDADNSICPGGSVTFTAGDVTGATYEFFVNGTSAGAANSNNTYTTTLLANGQTVTVKVTNGSCSATSTGITTTVEDKTAPELAGVPSAVTVTCEDIPAAATVTATDNCDASPAVTMEEVSTQGNDPENADFYNYTITRTWTAVDASGNDVSDSQVITVEDITAPELAGVPSAVTVTCEDIPAAATVTATDNCDASPAVTMEEVSTQGNDPENADFYNYTITRTWTAVDASGNDVSGSQVITVEDITAPELAGVPSAVTVTCEDIPAAATVTATDNCDASPAVTMEEVSTKGNDPENANFYNYTITRTWTAVDASGNDVSGSQVITVEDITAPELAGVPSAVTVTCEDIPAAATVTATDNCDASPAVTMEEVSTQGNDPENADFYNYTITRTWTAVDASGNDVSDSQVITVEDITAPELAGVPSAVTVTCEDIPAAATVTATDNCDASPAVTMEEVSTQGNDPENANFYNYTITRTWTAVDASGNDVSGSQVITVEDITAPELAGVPSAVTVTCEDIPAAATVTATDNCDASPAVTMEEVSTQGNDPENANFYNYTITRTWTAVDASGNDISDSQVITVEDITAPELAGVPAAVTVTCEDIPAAATVTATDNCDASPAVTMEEVSTKGNDPENANFYNYTITRTWTAVDASGNDVSGSQVITVEDITAPELAGVPSAVTVTCEDIPAAATVTATDNCDASPAVTMEEVSTQGNDPENADFYNYTITRTWTAVDASGNDVSDSQVITVEDITAPELAGVPSAVTVTCEDIPAAATVTATDNCDASPAVTMEEVSTKGNDPENANFYNYTITRTWTAVDASGNDVSGSQVITVEDITAPELAGVPSAVTVTCEDIPAAATVTATDNCDASPAVTMEEVSTQGNDPENADFYNYTITRTWTAVDASGNDVSDSQVITVEDITAPELAGVPSAVTVTCEDIPAAATVTATDNCDASPAVTMEEVSTQGNDPEDASFYNYTITRTWTAVDASGNDVSGSQVITVEDITAPELAGVPSAVTVTCEDIPAAATVTATDNCDASPAVTMEEVSTQGNDPENANFYNYTITRTWTAVDASGNDVSDSQVITVEDITAPELAGVPSAVTVTCEDIPAAATVTATDNCDASPAVTMEEVSTKGNDPENANFYNYTITRTWTAVDASGNDVSGSQVITVEDITAPELAGVPSAVTVTCEDIPAAATVTATDNCDASPAVTMEEVSTQGNDPENADFYNYTITRTWTAVDASGNDVSDSQVITVEDITAPELAGVPSAVTVTCEDIPAAATVTATDNCDASPAVTMEEVSTQGNDPEDASFYNYTITRTWTAVDASGNDVSGSQVITVEDITAPELAGVPSAVTVTCEDIPAAATVTATDNCDASPAVTMEEVSTQGNDPENANFYNYTITRTWTAVDASGNDVSDSQVITVEDITAPEIITAAKNSTVESDGQGNTEAFEAWLENNGGAEATDNCSDVVWTYTYGEMSDECGETGSTEVTFSATDRSGNTSTTKATFTIKDETAPQVADITAPIDPVQVGNSITVSSTYDDASSVTATWYFSSDGNFTDGDTYEFFLPANAANGSISNTFTSQIFSTADNLKGAGVYGVQLVVVDACGNETIINYESFLVIYDPTGGFVTGGGWIYSLPGSYPEKPTAEGRANFGFNAKYKTGKNNITEVDGNTNFQFKDGNFHFKSLAHEDMSLVISGDKKATYRGIGSVNGSGRHYFIVTVIDGDGSGGDGIDRFRITVFPNGSTSPSGQAIYDNEYGMAANADASTAIDGGSIVIHKPKASGNNKTAEVVEKTTLEVSQEPITTDILGNLAIAPNPVRTDAQVRFTLIENAAVTVRVFDFNGRGIDILYQGNVTANQVNEVTFQRRNLPSGVYIVKLTTDRGQSYDKQIIVE